MNNETMSKILSEISDNFNNMQNMFKNVADQYAIDYVSSDDKNDKGQSSAYRFAENLTHTNKRSLIDKIRTICMDDE